MIRFFNTLSGMLEEFKPLREGEVGLYTCGPTVYDYAHIGNYRTFVFEDLLRRFLEYKGYKVKHVMNITDVDDKTIAGALRNVGAGAPACPEEGQPRGVAPTRGLTVDSLNQYTTKYVHAFQQDLKTLNIFQPNGVSGEQYKLIVPRATEEISAMLRLIEQLVKNGAAYASDGSVYYRVSSFSSYGKLSKKNLEKNIKGARVDVDEYDKEESADFALWKKAKEGEPSWDSPWGKGRPGWHIECSAMSMEYLGETFDIHAGGEDLIFPHHENEIAQSEAATGKPFVKYWLHAKHLLVNGEKMSKSKGNFYTLRDLLAKGYDPMAIRYALLSTHYRAPLNFTIEGLKEASEVIKRLDDCYWDCSARAYAPQISNVDAGYYKDYLLTKIEHILKWLGDDLNISEVLAILSEAITEINKEIHKINKEALKHCMDFFKSIDSLLGLDVAIDTSVPNEVMDLVLERHEVRRKIKGSNDKSLWANSDKLRDSIQRRGWIIKDGRPGEPSTVKKKRRTWDFKEK